MHLYYAYLTYFAHFFIIGDHLELHATLSYLLTMKYHPLLGRHYVQFTCQHKSQIMIHVY